MEPPKKEKPVRPGLNYYHLGVTVQRLVKKRSEQKSPEALHILVPHCLNWPLTLACVRAFQRLTTRPISISIVNNFDDTPGFEPLLKIPELTFIEHRWTALGKLARTVFRKRLGSEENALALDGALAVEPGFEWAFMTHTDSAPLIRGWDDYYFKALKTNKVLGNYLDLIRVRAAHASGTLFHQKTLLEKGISLRPQYSGKVQLLDVGDRVSTELHDMASGSVPCLPNTFNNRALIAALEGSNPLIGQFARENSAISFDAEGKIPIFGHLGRGTPRSLNDSKFSHKLPQEVWIEFVESIG